jgi:hypothetical protein
MRGKLNQATPLVQITPSMEPPDWTFFYLTDGLLRRKTGVATVAAAFTDIFGMVLRLSMDAFLLWRGRGTWKLRSGTLTSTHAMEDLQNDWTQWINICIPK